MPAGTRPSSIGGCLMPMMEVHVKEIGPLFDRRGRAAVDRFERDSVKVLTDAGQQLVKAIFSSKFKAPTGYYLSRVITEITGLTGRVHDQMVIYGRWLEGVGSRNMTTRFKGYHAFREAGIVIDRDSLKILDPLIQKMLRELRG